MSEEQIQADWRIKLGLVLFVISIAWVLVLPIMPFLGFSGTEIAAFSGVMVVIAELLLVAGAAITGKEGFAYIKGLVFGVEKSYAPPEKVSKTRYTIGLILFVIPILLYWAMPYMERLIPGIDTSSLAFAIAGDVLLLISLFVLGGDFWNKLRSLFVHDAVAMFPERS